MQPVKITFFTDYHEFWWRSGFM